MRAAREKLHSRSGMSILLAMGLVLICAMVSSVIVLAAATGSSRTVYRTEQQQQYLAISSAAQLLMEEAREIVRYTGTATKKEYTCNNAVDDEGYVVVDGHVSDERYPDEFTRLDSDTSISGILAGLVEAGCDAFSDPNSTASAVTSFMRTFIISSNGDERLPDVSCTFYMYNDYSIVIVLAVGDPDPSYELTISMDASSHIDSDAEVAREAIPDANSDCLSHNLVKTTELGNGEIITEYKNNVRFDSYLITKTFTVSWSNIELKKGEVYA